MQFPKFRPWRVVIALSLLLIAIVAGVAYQFDPIAHRAAEFTAAGEPAYWKDLAPEPIPDDQNAEMVMRKAEKGLERIAGVLWAGPSQWIGEKTAANFTDADMKALEKLFDDEKETLDLLRQAASMPDSQFPLDYSKPPWDSWSELSESSKRYRSAMYCLHSWSHYLARSGEMDDVLKPCITMFQLSRHRGQIPESVSWMSACGMDEWNAEVTAEILVSNRHSIRDLQQLDALLDRESDVLLFRQAILLDRAYQMTVSGLCEHFYERPFVLLRNTQLIDALSDQLHLANVPYPEYRTKVRIPNSMPKRLPGSQQILDADFADKLRNILERTQAKKQCLRALVRFRIAHPGNDVGFDRMTDELLGEDPYTGKPLILKQTPRGAIIYSVGPNLVDDGGSLDDSRDIGIGPL